MISGAPVVDGEPGLRAFLHDSEIIQDFSLADHPRVGLAGLPRFRPFKPCQRIIVFGVVADNYARGSLGRFSAGNVIRK